MKSGTMEPKYDVNYFNTSDTELPSSGDRMARASQLQRQR
jgi:hypothetical protein